MFGTRYSCYKLGTMGKNFEQCTAMKFCCKVRFTAGKMWEMFVKAFGDTSVSCPTVVHFAVGEESIENAELSGRPETTKTSLK